MSNIAISLQDLSISALEKIIVPVAESSDQIKLAKAFENYTGFDSLRAFETFDAKSGSVWRFLHDSGEIILVGLGDDLRFGSIYKTLRKFSYTQRKLLDSATGLFIDEAIYGTPQNEKTSGVKNLATFTEAAVNGIVTGTNSIKHSDKLHLLQYDEDSVQASESTDVTEPSVSPLESIMLVTWNEDDENSDVSDKLLKAAQKALIIGESQLLSMHFINIPSNRKTPQQFANDIERVTTKHHIDCAIYDEIRLKNEGFDALLAVNRGSEYPARFVVLKYDGTPRDFAHISKPKHISLVGKGVTFDTGGLSIKPSESMPYMKCDMGGAAVVVSSILAIARLRMPVKITAVVPLTDNLVDAKSVKPGDIIGSYSNKTIEIIDTDAEGRLILADALSWVVQNTDAEHIIDLATLTGATVRTFGSHAAAIFSNSDDLSRTLIEASMQTGEKLWPLPLWDDYSDEISSDIADVRNFSGKPTAGSISAAKFLEVFIDKHTSWAHLDIAGTVFGDTEFGKQKNATGYGVRLLVEAVQKLS